MGIIEPPEFDRRLGLCFYTTTSPGIEGIIKYEVQDFIVEEITISKKTLKSSLSGEKIILSSPNSGNYVYAVIEKHGLEHYKALELIAKRLGIKVKQIGVAGIKDSFAISTQLISVKGVSPEELNKISGNKIKVLWVGRGFSEIKPGMLYGNHFRVTIRNINLSRSEIRRRVDRLLKEIERIGGVANFYGYQRFGLLRTSSHLVGRCIVKGDYEGAVINFIGNPFKGEPQDQYEARLIYTETQDPKKALRKMPKRLTYERRLLKYLVKHPGDYLGALETLPLSLLRLLIESYGSYLFNLFLCLRVREGLKINELYEGDLIAFLDSFGNPIKKVFEVGEGITLKRAKQLISLGRAIHVIPTPGYKIRLSGGFQGELEREVLNSENIHLRDFKTIEFKKRVRATGDYRPVLARVEDFNVTSIEDDAIFLNKKALVLEFTLKRGCYASVLLREIMKSKSINSYIGRIDTTY